MSGLRLKPTALGLLSCFFLLSCSGVTLISGHEDGPKAVKVAVREGSDAVLPCSLGTTRNLEGQLFDWKKDGRKEVFMYDGGTHYNNGRTGQDEQFAGRVSHFQDGLKHGDASMVVRNARLTDSGNYTCAFPRLQPSLTFYIQLVVELTFKDRSGEITGAAPEPCITILDVTQSGVLLQCDARGAAPQPKLQWQDGDGNVLRAEQPRVSERGGRYDVTLRTAVTKTRTNCFRCVVVQEAIGHNVSANITVHEKLFEETCSNVNVDVAGWLFGGFVVGALTVVAVLALLVATKRITIRRNEGSPQQTNGSINGTSALPLHQLV